MDIAKAILVNMVIQSSYGETSLSLRLFTIVFSLASAGFLIVYSIQFQKEEWHDKWDYLFS